jgi:hypothetical protein
LVKSSAFGLPEPGDFTTFFVALLKSAARTVAGDAVGLLWR